MDEYNQTGGVVCLLLPTNWSVPIVASTILPHIDASVQNCENLRIFLQDPPSDRTSFIRGFYSLLCPDWQVENSYVDESESYTSSLYGYEPDCLEQVVLYKLMAKLLQQVRGSFVGQWVDDFGNGIAVHTTTIKSEGTDRPFAVLQTHTVQ